MQNQILVGFHFGQRHLILDSCITFGRRVFKECGFLYTSHTILSTGGGLLKMARLTTLKFIDKIIYLINDPKTEWHFGIFDCLFIRICCDCIRCFVFGGFNFCLNDCSGFLDLFLCENFSSNIIRGGCYFSGVLRCELVRFCNSFVLNIIGTRFFICCRCCG